MGVVKENMSKKLLILLAIVLAASAPLAPKANAMSFSIAVGDQGYYYGPHYWHEGYYWVWVPGHWRHGYWVHGHYARRGAYNSYYGRHHFQHHRIYTDIH